MSDHPAHKLTGWQSRPDRRRHPAVIRRLRVAAAAAMLAAVGLATHTASASTVPDDTGGGDACSGAADESLEPYTIGFINQEAGSVGTFPEAIAASQAAVDYINTELCGFDGHMIELDTCQTDGTPATSQRCAEQMVNDGVPFVTGGLDGNMPAWYSILDGAGIPVIGGIPIAGPDFAAENSYMFVAGGAAAYPGSGRRTSSTSWRTSTPSGSWPMTPRARPRRSRSCRSRWRPRASRSTSSRCPPPRPTGWRRSPRWPTATRSRCWWPRRTASASRRPATASRAT